MQKQGRTSDTDPIRVNFLEGYWGNLSKGKLGITFAPGKKQPNAMTGIWNRDLTKDLSVLCSEYKVNVLVCLVESFQMTMYKFQDEFQEAHKLNIKTYHHPIVDGHMPKDHAAFKKLIETIVDDQIIKNDQVVVVHCLGGLGRAGTFAGASLIYRHVPAEVAIQKVRQVRSKRAIETKEQEDFLRKLNFERN